MGLFDNIGEGLSQVGGVFKGAGETLWETGQGVVDLGIGLAKTGYDLSPAGLVADAYEGLSGQDAPDWLPSAQRGGERVEPAFETAATLARNPGLLVDAVVQPIRDDWNNGHYGEAIGRGLTEVVLVVVGTKGVDKAAKGARTADAVNDLTHAGRLASRFDTVAPLTRSQIVAITDLPKGLRPDPSDYLPTQYIADHLALFEAGASRLQLKSSLDKYGPGQHDGTSFVVPREQADALLASAGGDPRALERALGLPEGQLDGDALMRVDFADPRQLELRLPSGNEAGANTRWTPGGRLPDGSAEAVIDVGGIPTARYDASPVGPWPPTEIH